MDQIWLAAVRSHSAAEVTLYYPRLLIHGRIKEMFGLKKEMAGLKNMFFDVQIY